MRNSFIIIVFVFGILASSCTGTRNDQKDFILSNDEIFGLIDRLEPNDDSTLNIHLASEMYLNDSCVVLVVDQNRYEPDAKTKILKQLKFRGIDVFVHNDTKDKAFFVPDSGLGLILLRRLNGANLFYKMDPLPNYDSTLTDEFDDLVPID
jgi:hypothetical protein